MPRFHDLTVNAVRKTIRDAVEVTLAPGEPAKFSFTPGQYLTFRQTIEGVDLRRNYSICTAPGNPLQVGVKRVEGGAFSTWANDVLKPGDRLRAMAPQGNFADPNPRDGGHFLAFAAGSGITPILSLIRERLARDPQATFTLVYANRAVATIMFREELEDLKNAYMGRFSLVHMLKTDAQEIDLFTGRLDPAKCAALFDTWIDVPGAATAYICGPEPMMQGVAEALKAAGMAPEAIRFELFTSAQPGRLPKRRITKRAGARPVTRARITLDGATQAVDIGAQTSVLEAALAHDLDVPFACRAGVCSTCRCRVLEGEVEMHANHALQDDEVARGYILSCQSYPVTDHLVVNYDG